MIHRESYERAVLHGMLIYNDMRAVGYLKPSNFKYKTGEVENSKIFEVMSRVVDFHERLKEFRKFGAWSYIYSGISIERGFMYDYLGVNTPKYCLLILEDIFEGAVREKLKFLGGVDSLYAPIVQDVFAQIEFGDMDCFEMAENILAYFRQIGFEAGVLSFEDLNESIDERVKQIKQNYEVDMLTTRLKRHCDDAGKGHLTGFLDTIKQGVSI